MGMNLNARLVGTNANKNNMPFISCNIIRRTYVGINVDTTLDVLHIKTADLPGSKVNRQGSLGSCRSNIIIYIIYLCIIYIYKLNILP